MIYHNHEVVPYSDSIKREVCHDLKKSIQVGLTVISKDGSHPTFICLTSTSNIYVLQPQDDTHVEFLRRRINKNNASYFTVDGMRDAYMLDKLNIDIENQVDLVTLDLHISLREFMTTRPKPPKEYSASFISEYVKPETLNYPKLITKWLNIDIDAESLKSSWSELDGSLDSAALEAIKSYAGPIQPMSVAMTQELQRLRDVASKSFYSMAVEASNQLREEFDRSDNRNYNNFCAFYNRCQPLKELAIDEE